MIKHSLKLLSLLLLVCHGYAFAQNNKVTGKVTDPESLGLPGVNIQVQGTTSGTVTDVDGNYQIEAPPDALLVFSYIGFVTQTVNVSGRSVINITMAFEDKALEEVVVTALGIKREAKSLGYAVSTVGG